MTPMLSGHTSIFGLVFLLLKSLLGIARQQSRQKVAILPLKPRSYVMSDKCTNKKDRFLGL